MYTIKSTILLLREFIYIISKYNIENMAIIEKCIFHVQNCPRLKVYTFDDVDKRSLKLPK